MPTSCSRTVAFQSRLAPIRSQCGKEAVPAARPLPAGPKGPQMLLGGIAYCRESDLNKTPERLDKSLGNESPALRVGSMGRTPRGRSQMIWRNSTGDFLLFPHAECFAPTPHVPVKQLGGSKRTNLQYKSLNVLHMEFKGAPRKEKGRRHLANASVVITKRHSRQ